MHVIRILVLCQLTYTTITYLCFGMQKIKYFFFFFCKLAGSPSGNNLTPAGPCRYDSSLGIIAFCISLLIIKVYCLFNFLWLYYYPLVSCSFILSHLVASTFIVY